MKSDVYRSPPSIRLCGSLLCADSAALRQTEDAQRCNPATSLCPSSCTTGVILKSPKMLAGVCIWSQKTKSLVCFSCSYLGDEKKIQKVVLNAAKDSIMAHQ